MIKLMMDIMSITFSTDFFASIESKAKNTFDKIAFICINIFNEKCQPNYFR